MGVSVHHGCSREVLRTLAAESVDACVTDAPYGLRFMGRKWDCDVPDADLWREVFRVLKPGAHVVAFFGTRTYHRGVCAIEDAGFEIRDQLAWLYGSGFPKSRDVSKAIDKAAGAAREVVGSKRAGIGRNARAGGEMVGGDHVEAAKIVGITAPATDEAARWQGWGTALKPSQEPIVLARKPLNGTVAANVLAHGCGALNIDGCRVGTDEDTARTCNGVGQSSSYDLAATGERRVNGGNTLGRWPANVVHDASAEVVEAFPETSSGVLKAGTIRNQENRVYGKGMAAAGVAATTYDTGGDSGSAARFFYSAKADAEDRLGSKHPTVKPVDLMAWLCRLVTPPGGTVLDPFAGTGTTGLAAMREGFDCILIEREAEYVADIERRLAWARGEGKLTAQEIGRHKQKPLDEGLFAA